MSIKLWDFRSFDLAGDYMPLAIILERNDQKDVLFVGDNIHNPRYDEFMDGYFRGLHDFFPSVLEEMDIEKVNIDNRDKLEKYKEYLGIAGNYVEFRDQVEIEEELKDRS